MAIVRPSPLKRVPLRGVGDDLAEWSSDKMQAFIQDHNRVALQWLRIRQFAQEQQALAQMAGMQAFAAVMAQQVATADRYRTEIRHRVDFLYEVANLFGADRWDSQQAAILEIRARAAAFANNPQSLGGAPLALGLAAVLAVMVGWLRWCSLESQRAANKMDADVRRFDAATEWQKRAEDKRLPPETRERYGRMAELQAGEIAGSTPDIGAEKSSMGNTLLWGVGLYLAITQGPKLLRGARGR